MQVIDYLDIFPIMSATGWWWCGIYNWKLPPRKQYLIRNVVGICNIVLISAPSCARVDKSVSQTSWTTSPAPRQPLCWWCVSRAKQRERVNCQLCCVAMKCLVGRARSKVMDTVWCAIKGLRFSLILLLLLLRLILGPHQTRIGRKTFAAARAHIVRNYH